MCRAPVLIVHYKTGTVRMVMEIHSGSSWGKKGTEGLRGSNSHAVCLYSVPWHSSEAENHHCVIDLIYQLIFPCSHSNVGETEKRHRKEEEETQGKQAGLLLPLYTSVGSAFSSSPRYPSFHSDCSDSCQM